MNKKGLDGSDGKNTCAQKPSLTCPHSASAPAECPTSEQEKPTLSLGHGTTPLGNLPVTRQYTDCIGALTAWTVTGFFASIKHILDILRMLNYQRKYIANTKFLKYISRLKSPKS